MDQDVGVGVGPSERAPHAGGDGPTPGRRRRMSVQMLADDQDPDRRRAILEAASEALGEALNQPLQGIAANSR